jgi:hypothetical protein
MNARSQHSKVWDLAGQLCALQTGALSALVETSAPNAGVHSIRLNDQGVPGQLLAIYRDADSADWSLPVVDSYVRGADLVATYQSTADWPYSPQLYWTANSMDVEGIVDSLSLLVSVQTHLLDTWPKIAVSSQLPCEELLLVVRGSQDAQVLKDGAIVEPGTEPCCILHRISDVSMSYLEIVPASDFCRLSVRNIGSTGNRSEWQLFADFLEKGVIRRSRVHTAFVPRENDIQLALECCETIERSPLPLTT